MRILALLLLAACGPRLPEGFEDVVIDPEASYTRTAPGDFVAWAGTSAARDQLLVALEAGADLDALLGALGAREVGRVPAIGLVQLALDAPDAAALDAAVEAANARAGVRAAFPNVRHTLADGVDRCDAEGDNDVLKSDARCAFEDVDAYNAALIWGAVEDLVATARVRVAVIDTGLGEGSGQFDDVQVLFLADPFLSANDLDGHGTKVASLIAADEGDGGIAGLATSLLGDKVQLLAGGADGSAMGDLFEIVFAVDGARADVVNLSWEYLLDPLHGGEGDALQAQFDRMFAKWPDTLFVLAAGNDMLVIEGERLVPQSTQAPNALVVGGVDLCDPLALAPFTNRGDAVRIAAPAVDVPVIDYAPLGTGNPSGPPARVSGTSFAAPIVAATAAVLRSVDPGLSPQEIVSTLRRWGHEGPAEVGGVRVATAEVYARVLLDAQPATARSLDLDEPLGEPDGPGLIGARLCRSALLTVEGWGSWSFESQDQAGAVMLLDEQFNVGLGGGEAEQIAWISVVQGQDFELGVDWAFPTPTTCSFTDLARTASGSAVSGSLRFVRCAITERFPFTGDTPAALELEIRADGVLEITEVPDLVVSSHAFQAQGVLLAAVFSQDEGLTEALEELCDGGYGQP